VSVGKKEDPQPKIVSIGGGTGLSTLLRGLKKFRGDISVIVTVTDDGGSSGRLREELNVLPPGDIRNCMIALSKTSISCRGCFDSGSIAKAGCTITVSETCF